MMSPGPAYITPGVRSRLKEVGGARHDGDRALRVHLYLRSVFLRPTPLRRAGGSGWYASRRTNTKRTVTDENHLGSHPGPAMVLPGCVPSPASQRPGPGRPRVRPASLFLRSGNGHAT